MKKRILNLVVIALCAIILLLPKFCDGVFVSGADGKFHASIIAGYINSFSSGNFSLMTPLSSIGANLGYGTPLFYPTIMHYLAALLSFVIPGSNDIYIAMDILYLCSIFMSGLTLYISLSKIALMLKMNWSSWIIVLASCIYMAFPYHLTQIYVRDGLSEIWIFVFLPLVLLAFVSLIKHRYHQFVVYGVLGVVGMMYSHIMTSFYILLLSTPFMMFFSRQFVSKKALKNIVITMVLILTISSPLWINLFVLKHFTTYGVFSPEHMGDIDTFLNNFIKPQEYINYFGFDDVANDLIDSRIPFYVIILGLISLICAIYEQNIFALSILLFGLWFLFLTSSSSILMRAPFLFNILQSPIRLLPALDMSLAIGCVYCLTLINNNIYINKLIIAVTFIIVTIMGCFMGNQELNASNRLITNIVGSQVIPYPPKQELNTADNRESFGAMYEYLPVQVANKDHDFYGINAQGIVVNGDTDILKNNVPNMTFNLIDVDANTTVQLPRVYYPGYNLYHNGQKIPYTQNNLGLISFNTPSQANGEYQLIYQGTMLQQVATLMCIIGIVTWLLLTRKG